MLRRIVKLFYNPILLGVLFIFYILIGLTVYSHYGISWDEIAISNHGHHIWNSIFGLGPSLFDHDSPYHGYLIPLLFSSLDRWFGFSDTRLLFQFRHLLSFLIYAFGVTYFFRISHHIYKSTVVSIFLTICFVLTPRLFAHSFFNPKDTIFLSLFVV